MLHEEKCKFLLYARQLDVSMLIRRFSFKRFLCFVFISEKLSRFSKRKLVFFQLYDVDLCWLLSLNRISSHCNLYRMIIICSKNCAQLHKLLQLPIVRMNGVNCLSFQAEYNFGTNDKDWNNGIESIEWRKLKSTVFSLLESISFWKFKLLKKLSIPLDHIASM